MEFKIIKELEASSNWIKINKTNYNNNQGFELHFRNDEKRIASSNTNELSGIGSNSSSSGCEENLLFSSFDDLVI